jgi:hypothetical protein
MVDDKFHTYRNRDSVARVERKRTSRRETTDTLDDRFHESCQLS